MRDIFYLQIVLGKKIYFPGIGLFEVRPKSFYKHYSFPEDLLKMSEYGTQAAWYTEKIVHGNIIPKTVKNGKIDFPAFDTQTFQIRAENKESFSWIQSVETKCKYLNSSIRKHLNSKSTEEEEELFSEPLKVELIQKYK